MKHSFLTALFLTVVAVTLPQTAQAAESKIVSNSQAIHLEQLGMQLKAIQDISSVQSEPLNNPSKAVENIHKTRLGERARRNKSNADTVENIRNEG